MAEWEVGGRAGHDADSWTEVFHARDAACAVAEDWKHGFQRLIAKYEMMDERGRYVHPDEAEQYPPDLFMPPPECIGKVSIVLNKRRQTQTEDGDVSGPRARLSPAEQRHYNQPRI